MGAINKADLVYITRQAGSIASYVSLKVYVYYLNTWLSYLNIKDMLHFSGHT